MKRLVLAVLILCFLITCGRESLAFWWERKEEVKHVPEVEETEKPAQQERIVEEKAKKITEQKENAKQEAQELAAKEEARKRLRELKQKKREGLNNTEWEIELSLSAAKEKNPEKDTITFKNNQISSANLSREGFVPTNYTLTIDDSGTFVCETMQSSEKGGIAFWRIEFDADMQKMHGILSHRISDEVSKDYSFVSLTKEEISPSAEE